MTSGNGLSDVYMAILIRLRALRLNRSVLGLEVLMWLLYSERALWAEELCRARGGDRICGSRSEKH